MSKFTTTSLIDFLEKFPKDLPIETELAIMWNYPDELITEDVDTGSDEFTLTTMENATDICIFEGDWGTGNVSDVDGKFEEFQKIRR